MIIKHENNTKTISKEEMNKSIKLFKSGGYHEN